MRRELGTAFERQTAALNAQLKAEMGVAFERNASVLNTQMKAQEMKKVKEVGVECVCVVVCV